MVPLRRRSGSLSLSIIFFHFFFVVCVSVCFIIIIYRIVDVELLLFDVLFIN